MDYKKAYKKALARAKSFRTDDNKDVAMYIFPELRQNENERIRKALIDGFKRYDDGALFNGCLVRDIVAWVEKQGNLMGALQEANKKINELVEENYYLKEEQKGKLVLTPEAYERVLKLGEKQGEQKPAWSEEDEKMIRALVSMCDVWATSHQFYPKENKEMEALKTWLKSLRPVPKNQWSKNDELNRQDTIRLLVDAKERYLQTDASIPKCIKWLENLSPQSTWKPSDEQMKVMSYLAKYYAVGIDEPNRSIITSLYEDLKKLREE